MSFSKIRADQADAANASITNTVIIPRETVHPASPETLAKLSDVTGLKVSVTEINGEDVIKLSVPKNIDREKFVDGFVAARNQAGISKSELPIADNAFGFSTHDPSGFYVQAFSITPDVLTKLEANKSEFKKLLKTTSPPATSVRPAP